MTMYHHAAAGVATLPSGRHSFPLDGGGGCAVGGEDEIDCRHHGGRGEARPGLGPHHRLDGSSDGLNGDADLYHRLVVHPRPLAQRLDVSIELAQPCRETVTENGVTKDVHVIVKQVPFSIHVRLPPPPLKAPKRECRLSERRCGKVRSDGDDDYHDHHHHDHQHQHQQHHDAALSPTAAHGAMVTDLRGLEMEVRLRYDGEGGRAVPFVQRPPLDVIATRVADDGRSAVLTARVRALSSQHQNRLFVAHVRAFTPPPSPEASADQSPATTTSSLPPSGAPSPATGGLEPASTVVLEALTEPIQVISKPRSSRKRVVRRKRTLGDMLLECTQRIERAQLAHAHAIGALSKRCRLVPRDNDATATAQQQLHHSYEPHAPPPPPQQQQQQPQSLHQQQQAGDGNAFLMSPLEDPQLMMLMDLPAAFPHSFLPASFVPGPEQHHPQHQQQHHHPFNAPYHHQQQQYQQQQHHHQADVKEELQAFFPAPTQRPLPAADDPLSPPLPGSAASPCSPACASSSSSAHHHHPLHQPQPQPQQQLHHPRDPRLRTAHAAAGPVAASASSQGAPSVAPASEDPVEAAAGAFLRSYAALPSFDRSMAIRRVLRKYGTDRLQALGSLLALLASRTPPPKRAPNPNEAASFQSCVCTSCSYEAELHNIDGFYKDLINLEFSFQ